MFILFEEFRSVRYTHVIIFCFQLFYLLSTEAYLGIRHNSIQLVRKSRIVNKQI